MCLVSIVMPVYNNEKYLKESLDSIVNLDYKNTEIIVIDDGSSDQSIEIVKEYCKLDSRILFFENKKNIGTAKTVKKAISKSSGKYVFFNAADDISLGKRIDKCLNIFEHNKKIGVIASTAIIINDKSQEVGKTTKINEQIQNNNISMEQFKRNYCLGATMAIVNDKSILLKEGMLEYIDDYETSIEYLMNGYEIYLLREPLVKYRIHDHNQSNGRAILSKKVKCILEKYKPEDIFCNLLGRGYAQNDIFVTLGIVSLLKEDEEGAIKYLNMVDEANCDISNTFIDFEKNFYLGVANYKLKNFMESLNKFQQAYIIDKRNPAILNNLGVLNYYEGGEKLESIKMIEEALRNYPDYIDAKKNMENITNNMLSNLKITERIMDIQVYTRLQYDV